MSQQAGELGKTLNSLLPQVRALVLAIRKALEKSHRGSGGAKPPGLPKRNHFVIARWSNTAISALVKGAAGASCP